MVLFRNLFFIIVRSIVSRSCVWVMDLNRNERGSRNACWPLNVIKQKTQRRVFTVNKSQCSSRMSSKIRISPVGFFAFRLSSFISDFSHLTRLLSLPGNGTFVNAYRFTLPAFLRYCVKGPTTIPAVQKRARERSCLFKSLGKIVECGEIFIQFKAAPE